MDCSGKSNRIIPYLRFEVVPTLRQNFASSILPALFRAINGRAWSFPLASEGSASEA
jgi:hypothetical protein